MVTTPIDWCSQQSPMKERMQKRGYRYNSQLVERPFLFFGRSIGTATNASLGNILVFVNAVSYGFYLITVKEKWINIMLSPLLNGFIYLVF
jgi:hypothetical protein